MPEEQVLSQGYVNVKQVLSQGYVNGNDLLLSVLSWKSQKQ